MAIVGVVAFVTSWLGSSCVEWAAERQLLAIRDEYLLAVMRQEMGWFDLNDAGTLSARLNENCIQIRDGIGVKFGQLFLFFSMFVGGFTLGFVRGWQLAIVMTATLPLLAVSGYFMMLMLTTAGESARKAYGEAGAVAEENLSNMRTVAAFGAEKKSLSRYCTALDGNDGTKEMLGKSFGMGTVMGVMFLTYALGFWYGGQLVADSLEDGCGVGECVVDCPPTGCPTGCFYGGDALTVFFSIVIAAFVIGQAGPNFTAMVKASTAMNDIYTLIDRESKIDPYTTDGIRSGELRGDIEFKDVEFRYPSRNESPIFAQLNLKIKAGQTVAFVGSSGCGKSTTIQLIQRFYDVDNGSILVDGADVRDYNVQWLRDQMAMVTQEPRLFNETITENIRYGRLDASHEDVVDAGKSANAHKFIEEFPDGYETRVGEAGGQLSGGQKQRVAIARAVIRNPKILILDEATSALDNESERIVQMTLDKLITETKRTTIIIAHRLSTIRHADRIFVLDDVVSDGSVVVEQGTHNELMAIENGLYYNLVQSQELTLDDQEQLGVVRKLTSSLSFAKTASMHQEASLAKLSSKYSLVALEGEQKKASFAESARIEETKKWWKREKKEKVPDTKPAPSMIRILNSIRSDWWKLGVGILGALVNGATFPVFAIVFGQFIAVYFNCDPNYVRSESAFWACMFVALSVSVFLSSTIQFFFFEWAGQILVRGLRADTFDALLHQEISFFDSPENSTGSLSSILSSEVMLVKGWISDNTGIYVQNFATLIYAIIIAFIASPQLAGVTLAGFFILMPASYFEMQAMKGSSDDVGAAATKPGFILNETVSNIKIVTSFCLQKEMRRNYVSVLADGYVLGRRKAWIFGLFFGFSQAAQYEVQALAYWYGAKLLEEGKITDVAAMLTAIFALIFAAMGFGQTAVFATDTAKAKDASRNVYYILDRVSKIDSRNPDGEELNIKGSLEIDHINFSYPQRQDVAVYKDLAFSVKVGSTVALVGESGCGKSTVVQLLERFYDVDTGADGRNGKILVDSCDVRDHRVSSLRSQIGLVSQEPVLFDTTIRENILYGRTDATDEEVVEAGKMANAHNFIMDFPDGYDTRVGKGGGKLSGGQKQRVAIARAMLRDPKILLLDEATSALDSESERVVQQALDELLAKKKRTTLVIAHRLSTIKGADQIVVLSNEDKLGSVVAEKGTHSELIAKNGIYAKLVKIAAAAGDV
eukprot:Lankesteria_metandrocarpae@DN5386_c0_g2_i1.p1